MIHLKKLLFRGAATALITPFDEDGMIDFDTLGVLIDRQAEGGIDALVACGTTGESATLSDYEFSQVVGFFVHRAAGRVPVIAGTGGNNTAHCLERSQTAQRLGADGLLMVNPYYNKSTQAGLVAHYSRIAQGVDLPILLYNVPSRTAMSFTADTYARLAQIPNIVGVKEASGDLSLVLATRAKCPADFALYSGNDDQIVPILALGGQGVISTMSNLIPGPTHDICAAWFAGSTEEAARLQTRWQPLIEALFSETNPIPLKAALAMMGYDSGVLRLPLVEMSAPGRERLKKVMVDLGVM